MSLESNISTRLESMKGKSYLYKDQAQTILHYRIEGEYVDIATDLNFYTLKLENAASTLDKFLLCEPTAPTKITTVAKLSTPIHTVVDLIKSNITKVQADKEFVPQANTINDSLKLLIDLAKTEVEYMKTIK